jgi:hypothetical protein
MANSVLLLQPGSSASSKPISNTPEGGLRLVLPQLLFREDAAVVKQKIGPLVCRQMSVARTFLWDWKGIPTLTQPLDHWMSSITRGWIGTGWGRTVSSLWMDDILTIVALGGQPWMEIIANQKLLNRCPRGRESLNGSVCQCLATLPSRIGLRIVLGLMYKMPNSSSSDIQPRRLKTVPWEYRRSRCHKFPDSASSWTLSLGPISISPKRRICYRTKILLTGSSSIRSLLLGPIFVQCGMSHTLKALPMIKTSGCTQEYITRKTSQAFLPLDESFQAGLTYAASAVPCVSLRGNSSKRLGTPILRCPTNGKQ